MRGFLNSTQKLYEKIAKGELTGFTVPAFNIRTLTFDVARALFRAAKREKAGAFIIELAQSEMEYTNQTPEEYTKTCLKAAKTEKFTGPIFLQGDHFESSQNTAPASICKLIRKAIAAGFYNVDIDCSSLPMEENIKQTNYFVQFIKKTQPKNITISIGGEVGEIGGKNTTIDELERFLKGAKGIIKVAVQTGTAHGKGGEMDFRLLRALSEKAKEYGLAGVVQHGASTLPEEQFKKFPAAGACEIHLATIFQNIILDHPAFPQELKEKVGSLVEGGIEKKKALGLLKKDIWGISQKNIAQICEQLEEKFAFFFKALNVSGTKDLIKKIYY